MAGTIVNAATGLALQADDDERLSDLDMRNINDLEDAKQKIIKLRRDQLRATDYQQRLRRKLAKLDEALAARREEVESTQRTLQLEKGKEMQEKESAKREGSAKEKTQNETILNALSEVLYTKQVVSGGDKAVTAYELDTVLVTYVRGKFRYPLNFRINEDTTIKTLRQSACKYWGVKNPDQFILKTMANNKCQDEVKVKECFKQGELPQLSLTEKPELERGSHEPTEDERKAIQPKGGKKKKDRGPGFDPAGADKQQNFSENFFSEVRRFGGIYFLLRSRDSKPSEHQAKIRLSDMIVYVVLAALSCYVYYERRPPGQEYWYVRGIEEQVTKQLDFPSAGDFSDRTRPYIPGFKEVSTQAEMWDWLIYTLPSVMWTVPAAGGSRSMSLDSYNLLLGFLNIRIQNVKPVVCENAQGLTGSLGLTCYPRSVNTDTQETGEMANISTYWAAPPVYNDEIRGSMANPSRWSSAEVNAEAPRDIANTIGYVDVYDPSGYSVDWRFKLANVTTGVQQYMADMQMLKDLDWIGQKTRVVIISFTMYNYQYDHWLASQLVFEMPPSGALHNAYTFRPFKPTISETKPELDYWYTDCIRLIIGMYIIIFVGYAERRHKIRNHKAGCWYHASLNGICDVGIVACIMCVTIWRTAEFESKSTEKYLDEASAASAPVGQEGFVSYVDMAFDWETMYCVEGLMMLLLMFRMLSFTRLNYYVMQVKRTLGRAVTSFVFFSAVFLPMLGGFVFISHTVFGSTLQEYALLSKTIVQMYHLGEGNLNLTGLMQLDVVGTMVLVIFFYALLTFLLLNAFATVVIDAHYFVRLNSGGREPWDRKKWLTWATPTLVANIFYQLKAAVFPQTPLESS